MALRVNGQVIDDGALESEFAGIKAYHERLGNVSCCERNDEFRGMARQNLVARVLLAQEAQRAVPEPPGDEVEAALAKLAEQHGGQGRFLAALGAGEEDLGQIRAELSLNLRVERLVDEACAAEGAPGEADVRAYYDANAQRFMTAEEVRASHISRSPPRGEQREKALEEYRQVRRRLMAGEDFDALALEHSERGKEQIDLGFFKRGELPEEFETVAFSMEVGEVSPVFQSQVGLHIVKVTDRRPPRPVPFDEARPEAERMLKEERRQATIRRVVAELEKTAAIEEVEEAAGYEGT